MNYDKAHDLAHAMRESEEYKELMAAQEAVKADAVATGLVRTFMAQQMQWEYAKCVGARFLMIFTKSLANQSLRG